jgi:hypothetical protein
MREVAAADKQLASVNARFRQTRYRAAAASETR